MLLNGGLRYRSFGNPGEVLRLETSEMPARREGALRLKMLSAPINPSDVIPITGAYRHRVSLPRTAGYEGIGVVIETDGSSRFKVSDRVIPLRTEGTWQQYLDCPMEWAIAVPREIDILVGARSFINPLSAALMLDRWQVTRKHLAITAAGSTCGMLLGQWALNVGAETVTAIVRSARHLRMLEALGMRVVCSEEPREIAAACASVDVVFDAIGGKTGGTILDGLRAEAQFVSYGLLNGNPIPAGTGKRQATLFRLRDHLSYADAAGLKIRYEHLWPLIHRSILPNAICFPLERWEDALSYFNQKGRNCKPMLLLDSHLSVPDMLLFSDGEIAGPDTERFAAELHCRKPAAEFVAKRVRLAATEDRDVTPVLSALAGAPHLRDDHERVLPAT